MKYIRAFFANLFKLYIALLFFITLLLLYPVFWVLLRKKKWHKYTFAVNVAWSYFAQISCLFILVKRKKGKLPEGPYIICANHSSFLDIFLMYSAMPYHRFLFLGKGEMASWPLIGLFFRKLNIPVHRNSASASAKALLAAKRAVNQGWSLVIFPEGGIQDDKEGKMAPFKEGAFQLAQLCDIPIIPVSFKDHHHMLSEPHLLFGTAHPGISRMYIHEAILPENEVFKDVDQLRNQTYDTILSAL